MMTNLWLWCLLISAIGIASGLNTTDVPPETNFGLQLPGNDTGCEGDPHGNRLKNLCDHLGMSCCLSTDPDGDCGPGLCLDVAGGDDNSIGTLLPQLPVDNITLLNITKPAYIQYPIDLRTAKVCTLSNLQSLLLVYAIPSNIDEINCLTKLRLFILYNDIRYNLTITERAFHGLDHLWLVHIQLPSLSLSAVGMMQLVNSAKNNITIVLRTNMEQLDVWPLCLAQKQHNLNVYLDNNRIFDLQNTLSPTLCNIEENIQADVEISLRYNAISHVSDIASGWGFDSLHHFIANLITEHSSTFPIWLEGNPFECDCMDMELYQMLRNPGYNASLTNLASLICQYPPNLKGRRFDSLLDSDLNCDSPPLPLILGVSIGGAVLLILSLVGFLFYNRVRLRPHTTVFST